MYRKVGTPQVSKLKKVSIGRAMQNTSSPKKSQKIKWDKNPTKDKRTFAHKKPWDITKFIVSTIKSWDTLLRTTKR